MFVSWGVETVKKFSVAEMENALNQLQDEATYGVILRAKGIVAGEEKWVHFDYVPEEHEVRYGAADYTGRLCVIGAQLNEHALHHLFGL